MYKALFTAASGMRSQQMHIDTIANNLANVNTNGFKASALNFQDLLYENMATPGTEVAEGNQMPTGLEIGSGVRVVSSSKVFRQGEMEQTERELDLAVMGTGFFRVTMPDGTTGYTRDGQFGLDGQRRLVRSDGRVLADNITIPADTRKISIGSDGRVYTLNAAGTEQTLVGSLQLATFPNPAGLQSVGDNLYLETVSSGSATVVAPGAAGNGEVRQGFLERSNVDVVSELVHMISAQRAYEISTKAITISDRMLSEANNLVR